MTTDQQPADTHFAGELVLALLDSASDAIVVESADGVITTWSRAAARILGVDRSAALGTSVSRFAAAGAADRWTAWRSRVLAGEHIDVPAVSLQRADGQSIDASMRLMPLANGDVVTEWCLVIRDLTEALSAQETLTAGEERVRRSENLAGTGTFVIDAADRSEQWSIGMYPVHDVDLSGFDGSVESHVAIVHPDDRDTVRAVVDGVLAGGVAGEADHRLAADESRWVFLAVEPLRDDNERIVGASGACQDITSRKQAEAAVREALETELLISEELRRLDTLKDDFLATVSHELRTPLTSIRGFSSLLAKQHPELSTLVDPIERNGADMSRMIETLLDFCRLQAGQVTLRLQPVDLHGVTENCLRDHDGSAGSLRLVNEIAADYVVHADPDAVQRILTNLIGNACRYAKSGTCVTVSAERHDDGTLIAVSDDGPGIAPEHVEHLFERFFQVPETVSRRGTGIGLAIVAEYVAKLSGEVWCDSTVGAGTTFFVRLP